MLLEVLPHRPFFQMHVAFIAKFSSSNSLLPIVSLFAIATSGVTARDLNELSLEQLGEVPVVVNEKPREHLFDTPTGSYVFNEEDIERLPVNSLPELLRYAPGTHIQRPSNGIWGIGIRGMNSRFTNRVLFTVDEHNIYGSLFSGLYGNEHDLLFDDIASIEVVYGPGGSLWSTHAMNGMANVIMKSAFETENSIVRVEAGTENTSISARHGWQIDNETSARVYTKITHREPSLSPEYDDDWNAARVGFHLDKRQGPNGLFTFSAEAYKSDLGYALNLPDLDTGSVSLFEKDEEQIGGNIQLKWVRQPNSDTAYTTRGWLSYTDIDAAYVIANLYSAGVESRYRKQLNDRTRLDARAGATIKHETLNDTPVVTYENDVDESSEYAFFGAELAYSVIPNTLEVSSGFNATYNSYLDSQYLLPDAHVIYHLSELSRIWASITIAERPITPAAGKIEDILLSVSLFDPQRAEGQQASLLIDRQFNSGMQDSSLQEERLDAYEIGFRHEFNDKGSFDLSVFSYHYDEVIGAARSSTELVITDTPYLLSNSIITNFAYGDSFGIDTAFDWKLPLDTRARLTYSYIQDQFYSLEELPDGLGRMNVGRAIEVLENNVPTHLASLAISKDFNENLKADFGLRYSSEFKNPIGTQEAILQGDLKIIWTVNEDTSLSLIGRNLFDPSTNEKLLKDILVIPTEIQREFSIEFRKEF